MTMRCPACKGYMRILAFSGYQRPFDEAMQTQTRTRECKSCNFKVKTIEQMEHQHAELRRLAYLQLNTMKEPT
jgi:C4-type Zn-finger protein